MPQKIKPLFKADQLMNRPAQIKDAKMNFDLCTDPEIMKNVGFPFG